jgi:hypothetical protein
VIRVAAGLALPDLVHHVVWVVPTTASRASLVVLENVLKFAPKFGVSTSCLVYERDAARPHFWRTPYPPARRGRPPPPSPPRPDMMPADHAFGLDAVYFPPAARHKVMPRMPFGLPQPPFDEAEAIDVPRPFTLAAVLHKTTATALNAEDADARVLQVLHACQALAAAAPLNYVMSALLAHEQAQAMAREAAVGGHSL